MRLKKGSKAAKAWGAKMRRLRNSASSNSIKSKPSRKMARKKRYGKKRSYKKSASILGFNLAKILAPMLYGGVRSKVSTYLSPYTSKIPMGEISDEVGMLAVTTLAKKYLVKSKGTLRDALTAGQAIELARIGDFIATNGVSALMPSTSSSSSNSYVFA